MEDVDGVARLELGGVGLRHELARDGLRLGDCCTNVTVFCGAP